MSRPPQATCNSGHPLTPENRLRGVGRCRICHNKKRRAWHYAHREHNVEYQRKWRAKNREYLKLKYRRLYHANREENLAYLREWRKKHPGSHRRRHYRSAYNISVAELTALRNQQDERCAICKTKETELKTKIKVLCVDHDHATGRVRGLLCQDCNHGLGNFKDNRALLLSAARYVKKLLKEQ